MKKKFYALSILTMSLGLLIVGTSSAYANLPPSVDGQSLPSLAPMLEKIVPAVVSVNVTGTEVAREVTPREFQFFFPNLPLEREKARPFQGQGSGVVIDAKKGYVITNEHVIRSAEKIKVQLNDGREYTAKLIGRDELSDIALLQLLDAKNLTAIKIANSDNIRIGDFAVAIGNPFGLGQTVTSGIISALGRSGLNLGGGIEDFIQTDASINRGNSGGALVNLRGELIGINTAILAPTGGSIGIGFAIPSNIIASLSEQMIKFGHVQRGVLGISGNDMDANLAKALKIDLQKGAFVSKVEPSSAAAKAGIKAGDVIVSFDSKPIQSFSELRAKILTSGPKKITLGLVREGKTLSTEVTLTQQPQVLNAAASLNPHLEGASFSNGEEDGVKGIKVNQIVPRSPAARLGLRDNDLILSINGQKVETIDQLTSILGKNADTLLLDILRDKQNFYIILR